MTASLAVTRMKMTILTWDIAGSCALLSALSLETYCHVVRTAQERAAETIEAHGGFIARYMGDSVLAYFGYPATHGDDAERAVRAALALDLRWAHPGVTVRSRAAIATGTVIVGPPLGTLAARECPAFGAAPNLAARLIGVAQAEEVVVDDATRSACAGLFGFRKLGGLHLKGFPDVRRAWRVTPVSPPAMAGAIARRCVPARSLGVG